MGDLMIEGAMIGLTGIFLELSMTLKRIAGEQFCLIKTADH